MPIKKLSPAAKKPVAEKKPQQKVEHSHEDLVKEIELLKKASSLNKSQCHSCCADVETLKKDIASLKSALDGLVKSLESGKSDLAKQILEVLKESGELKVRKNIRSRKL